MTKWEFKFLGLMMFFEVRYQGFMVLVLLEIALIKFNILNTLFIDDIEDNIVFNYIWKDKKVTYEWVLMFSWGV